MDSHATMEIDGTIAESARDLVPVVGVVCWEKV